MVTPFFNTLEVNMAFFGYGRVSTTLQNTINQKLELEQAGFKIDFWFSDTGISSSTLAASFSILYSLKKPVESTC